MRVLDPGHVYKLDWLDGYPEVAAHSSVPHRSMSEAALIFVKREGYGYPGNDGHHASTTLQEVLRACIDRVKYLDLQVFDARNHKVLNHLREAIWLLEDRAAERHGREFTVNHNNIEELLTCPKCLHIGCEGGCRT